MTAPAKHVHKFERHGSVGYPIPTKIIYRCKCGVENERKPTCGELAEGRHTEKMSGQIHRVWYAFSKAIGDKGGFEAMEAAETFAASKIGAGNVWIVGVDDDHHASSSLVFVAHECDDYFWGTSVMFIPQCSGGPPVSFFLYPGHLDGLLPALRAIQKRQQAKPDKHVALVRRARAAIRRKQRRSGAH